MRNPHVGHAAIDFGNRGSSPVSRSFLQRSDLWARSWILFLGKVWLSFSDIARWKRQSPSAIAGG